MEDNPSDSTIKVFGLDIYLAYLIGFFLILVLPLINLPPWFSPPDWGKTVLFRIFMSVLLFLFFTQLIDKEGGKWLLHRLRHVATLPRLPLLIFFTLLLLFLLSTIFSVDPSFSFQGDPTRSGGFLNLALYFAFASLTFLLVKAKDWQKIWDVAIGTGAMVALIAVFQQFHLFSVLFITTSSRPPSTIGGSIFLGVYLLFLVFLTFSLFLSTQSLPRRLFYFCSLLLFLIAIFLSGSRAAYIALFLSFVYFIFFLPVKGTILSKTLFARSKIILAVKTFVILFFVFTIGLVYLINTNPGVLSRSSLLAPNPLLQTIARTFEIRLSVHTLAKEPRPSAWRIGLEALAQKPLLGYGLENFSVGFDRFFDPSLPNFEAKSLTAPTNWWDRAHNIFLDIGNTAGIPAMILYTALFAILAWQLRQLKKRDPSKSLLAHAIQTTFLAYFLANFFIFDTFPTYLLIFLFIAYTFFLLQPKTQIDPSSKPFEQTRFGNILGNIAPYQAAILILPFIGLLLFTWFYNINPLLVNAKINTAAFAVSQGRCDLGLPMFEKAIEENSMLLGFYSRTRYVDAVQNCRTQELQTLLRLNQSTYDALVENTEIRPHYTRSWIFRGGYAGTVIEAAEKKLVRATAKEIEDLKEDAKNSFEIAHALSPDRQEVYVEWVKLLILTKDYEEAKQRASECVALNPINDTCEWLKQITEIYTGDRQLIEIGPAREPRFGPMVTSPMFLPLLASAYSHTKNNEQLMHVYQRFVELAPYNVRYFAALASVYEENSYYQKAHQTALAVLAIDPSAKSNVESFLNTLPAEWRTTEKKDEYLAMDEPNDYLYHLTRLNRAYIVLLQDDPGNVLYQTSLVSTKEELQAYKEKYAALTVQNPENADYQLTLAKIARVLGERELVRQALLSALKIDPNMTEAQDLLRRFPAPETD